MIAFVVGGKRSANGLIRPCSNYFQHSFPSIDTGLMASVGYVSTDPKKKTHKPLNVRHLIGSGVAEKEADHFMKWPRLLGQDNGARSRRGD